MTRGRSSWPAWATKSRLGSNGGDSTWSTSCNVLWYLAVLCNRRIRAQTTSRLPLVLFTLGVVRYQEFRVHIFIPCSGPAASVRAGRLRALLRASAVSSSYHVVLSAWDCKRLRPSNTSELATVEAYAVSDYDILSGDLVPPRGSLSLGAVCDDLLWHDAVLSISF